MTAERTSEVLGSPGQGQLGLHDELAIDKGGRLRMDEIRHASRDARFQPDDLTGFGGAEEFYSSQSGQLELADRSQKRIGLGHGTRELRRRFHQENSGEQRLSRKVAGQKGFIAAYLVLADASLAWLQALQPIQKSELGTVGQAAEGGGQQVSHWKLSE